MNKLVCLKWVLVLCVLGGCKQAYMDTVEGGKTYTFENYKLEDALHHIQGEFQHFQHRDFSVKNDRLFGELVFEDIETVADLLASIQVQIPSTINENGRTVVIHLH